MNRVHAHDPFAEDLPPKPASGPPPAVPVVAQYVVLGSAVATTLVLVAAGIIVTLEKAELMSWWRTTATHSSTLDLVHLLGGFTALTNLVAFIATGLWLLQIRAIAEWASPRTYHRRSAYWAFLGWIVPVVDLWFPYQVVADASRALGSTVTNFWPWWIAWLGLTFYSLLEQSGGELATVQDLITWIRVQQLGAVVAVIACILWWRVVRSATSAARAAVRGG